MHLKIARVGFNFWSYDINVTEGNSITHSHHAAEPLFKFFFVSPPIITRNLLLITIHNTMFYGHVRFRIDYGNTVDNRYLWPINTVSTTGVNNTRIGLNGVYGVHVATITARNKDTVEVNWTVRIANAVNSVVPVEHGNTMGNAVAVYANTRADRNRQLGFTVFTRITIYNKHNVNSQVKEWRRPTWPLSGLFFSPVLKRKKLARKNIFFLL